MSRKTLHLILMATALAVGSLFSQSLYATTNVAVGPVTCQPHLVHFATIQAAVNAVPFNTTILVCPGTYPEQVVIAEPLTLKGVTDGTGNAAIITVPATGLVVNAPSNYFGPVTAQLLVENTVGVNISDITVDGTGSTCVAGANRTVGVEFYNVGTANDGVTAGKIQNTVVRNEVDGCALGEGILADTAFVTISGNEIHDIDRSGIITDNAKSSITNNSIQNGNINGIALDAANSTIVSLNTITNSTQAGILVQNGTSGAVVTKNDVSNVPSDVGIWLLSAYNSTVTGNKVSNAGWTLVLQDCFRDTVQTNLLSRAGADGILDQASFGGNVITKNTVNEAAFGVFSDASGSADTLVPNTLYNVVVTIDPSPADTPNPPVTP